MRLRRSTRLNEVTCTLKDTEVGNVSRVGLGGGTWAWTMRCESDGPSYVVHKKIVVQRRNGTRLCLGAGKIKSNCTYSPNSSDSQNPMHSTGWPYERFHYHSDSPPSPIPSPPTVPVRRSPIRRRASLRSTPIRSRPPRSTIRRAIPSTVRRGPAGSSTAIRSP